MEGGADIVELGIPFSDPIADGPTIQNAVSRSLANGCRPLDVIKIAQKVREKYEIPLVAMTYYNPIFRIGLRKFLHLAQGAGISGLIVPDLPSKNHTRTRQNASQMTWTLYSLHLRLLTKSD